MNDGSIVLYGLGDGWCTEERFAMAEHGVISEPSGMRYLLYLLYLSRCHYVTMRYKVGSYKTVTVEYYIINYNFRVVWRSN